MCAYTEVIKTRLISVHAQLLSCVQLFATPWTIDGQAPLYMGLSRQEYWSGLLFPLPEDLPDLQIEPVSLVSPDWQVGSLPLHWEKLTWWPEARLRLKRSPCRVGRVPRVRLLAGGSLGRAGLDPHSSKVSYFQFPDTVNLEKMAGSLAKAWGKEQMSF